MTESNINTALVSNTNNQKKKKKIKEGLSDISSWLNVVDTDIKKIYLILNTCKKNKKIIFSDSDEKIFKYIKYINLNIDLIDIWINRTLKSYDKIIIDISKIEKILFEIKQIDILNINAFYEYTKIINRSIMFFKILFPIIKEVSNFKEYMIEVIEIIISNKKRFIDSNENKKRKLDKDYEKSNELLEEEKVKDNTFSTNITDVNTIRNNKMQDKLDTGIDLILKASQVKD
jgi:hypothetical protein